MRLLIDSSSQGRLSIDLATAGHDVVSVDELWQSDPGDDEILLKAYQEQRTLITRDKDFGELAVLHGQMHCGIVRLWDTSAPQQFLLCQAVLTQYESELIAGSIITASPYRIRIRPPLQT